MVEHTRVSLREMRFRLRAHLDFSTHLARRPWIGCARVELAPCCWFEVAASRIFLFMLRFRLGRMKSRHILPGVGSVRTAMTFHASRSTPRRGGRSCL